MVSLRYVDSKEIKEYVSTFDLSQRENAVANVDLVEIDNHFRINNGDKFLVLKCVGSFDEVLQELDCIRFPSKSFGKLLIVNGNRNLTIDVIVNWENAIKSKYNNDLWNPVLNWSLVDTLENTEYIFITKIYAGNNLSNEVNFNSMWDAIVYELNETSKKGFYDCLRSVRWRIIGNCLIPDMRGNARGNLLLSMKKQEIEENIYEYTGKRIFIKMEER